MNAQEFNQVVDELMAKSKNTLIKKADEYNLTADRLESFKNGAKRQQCTPARALLGYMDKHVGSIYDYVVNDTKMTREMALEKFGDLLNYTYLLFAVMQEAGFQSNT